MNKTILKVKINNRVVSIKIIIYLFLCQHPEGQHLTEIYMIINNNTEKRAIVLYPVGFLS